MLPPAAYGPPWRPGPTSLGHDCWPLYPWASPGGCGALGLFHSENSNTSAPDLQLHIGSLSLATDFGANFRHNFNTDELAFEYIEPHLGGTSASIIPTLNRPKSRGRIKLRNSSPYSHPIIDPRYLAEEEDVTRLISGLKFGKKVAETEAFKRIGAKIWERKDDPYCGGLRYNEEEYWRCYVRTWSFTVYHPVGTCSMGKVTDEKLKEMIYSICMEAQNYLTKNGGKVIENYTCIESLTNDFITEF